MNRFKYLSPALLSIVVLFTSPIRAEEKPIFIQFVRPLGMGGAFTAVTDDSNSFSYNPAGIVQRTGSELTILEIAGGGAEDTLTAIDFISDNESDLTNFNDPSVSLARRIELINEIRSDIAPLDPRVNASANIASYVSGPKFMGLPAHVGFGALGSVDSSFRLDAVLVPTISFDVNNDLLLPLTVAHRFESVPLLPGKLGIGVTGKLFRRNQIKRDNLTVYELDDLEAPPVAEGFGYGSDIGLLYQPTTRWNVGVMVQDFLGTKVSYDSVDAEKGYQALPERDTVIRPRTNIGLALVPESLLWILPTGDRLTLSADIRDIFIKDEHLFFQDGFKKPFGENLPTHLHFGAEYRYWFLRLRSGANQGYLTLGVGIDLPIFKLDYAYYGRELAEFAGDKRQDNHMVSLAFRFGSGNVEARERIAERKEMKKQKGSDVPPGEEKSSDVPEDPSGLAADDAVPAGAAAEGAVEAEGLPAEEEPASEPDTSTPEDSEPKRDSESKSDKTNDGSADPASDEGNDAIPE